MSRRAVAAVLVAGALLTGCAADVRGELRRAVADLTEDANARDADAVRSGADALLERLDGDVRSGELTQAEADRIAELARVLRERADLLAPEPVEEPTEEPTEEATEEPTEEPEDEPSPSPTRSPSPSPSPEPEPEPEPEPTAPEPTDETTLVPDLTPG